MQPNYSYELTWSPADKGYISTSAEFPGVSAFGPDQQTALAEMSVALEAVLDTYAAEGRPLPAPLVERLERAVERSQVPGGKAKRGGPVAS